MKIFNIIKYIVQHNRWNQVPKKLMQAVIYQIYKRLSQGVCSKTLFNQAKILLFPQSPISSALVYSDCPDESEITALRALANDNTIFLDIGANIGSYSLLMLDKVKKVYAFEAHPETARWCQMNFILNNQSPHQVIAKAVSGQTGIQYFSNQGAGDPTNALTDCHEHSIEVPAIALDEFVAGEAFEQTDELILKLDVEGFEHEVLAGAQQVLSTGRVKAILFEAFSDQLAEINSQLQRLGYDIQPIGAHNQLAVRQGETAMLNDVAVSHLSAVVASENQPA